MRSSFHEAHSMRSFSMTVKGYDWKRDPVTEGDTCWCLSNVFLSLSSYG